jgi:hypothetical protein
MRLVSSVAILLSFAFAAPLAAQVWLEVGPKATLGPSGYYNSALANDSQHDYSLNFSFNYGAAVGLNFGDYHGLNVEALWGTYFQDLISLDNPDTINSVFKRNNLEWEVIDLYALYRYYPESGYYLELGPKFTRITGISQNLGIDPLDIEGMYEDNYISGVIGFGAFLSGSKVMVIKAGLRLEYGLTDLVSEQGMAANFPASYANNLELGSTTPFRASFGLEMSFGVGGVAQGACGRRGFVLGGRY